MTLLTCVISDFVTYKQKIRYTDSLECVLRQPFKPEHTYVFIVGPSNKWQHEFLKSLPDIKIVYESPKAVNRTPGHGTEPRNTLLIIETIKEPDEIPEVRAVPEVPKKRA